MNSSKKSTTSAIPSARNDEMQLQIPPKHVPQKLLSCTTQASKVPMQTDIAPPIMALRIPEITPDCPEHRQLMHMFSGERQHIFMVSPRTVAIREDTKETSMDITPQTQRTPAVSRPMLSMKPPELPASCALGAVSDPTDSPDTTGKAPASCPSAVDNAPFRIIPANSAAIKTDKAADLISIYHREIGLFKTF
jgi:hypothetical protein